MTNEQLAVVKCAALGRDVVLMIESARMEATMAERERCAKIVEAHLATRTHGMYPESFAFDFRFSQLAAEIRNPPV